MTLERLTELAELGIITQTQIVEYYTDPEHSDELAEMSEEDLLNIGLVTRVACPELLLDDEQPSDEDYEDVADAESLKAIVEGGGAAHLASSIDMSEEIATIPAGQRVFLKIDEGVELKVRTIQASKGSALQVEGGKISSSQAGSTLRVSNCNLIIKGAEIVNDYSGKSTSGAVNDTGSSNIVIEDSKITADGMNALVINSKSKASVKNTEIVSASNSGIVVKSVNPVTLENVSVTANTEGRVDASNVIAALQATVAAKIKISGEDTKMSTRGDNPTVFANWANTSIEIEAGEYWVDEPGEKNYTLNQKDGIEGSCFSVSGGKFRGFNPEASAEADRRSFLKEGYVARESEGVWEVIPGVYSEYVAEASMPEKVVAGIENPMSVTLKTAKEGTASYQKVRIYFETECPEGGQVTYKISAEDDQEFEFVNDGAWGPEEGFELPIEYEATTSLKAIPSMAGTYKTITRLVDLATGRNIIEDIADVEVVEPIATAETSVEATA